VCLPAHPQSWPVMLFGQYPEGVGAVAALIGSLRELRSRDVNVSVGRLRYAIDEEVPATAAGVQKSYWVIASPSASLAVNSDETAKI